MTGLVFALETRSPIALLRIAGELGLTSGVALRAALRKVLAEQPKAIVVDVSGVTVRDDLILTVFTGFASTAGGPSGCPVVLCEPSPALASALHRWAIDRTVRIFPTRAEALAALDSAPPTRRYRRRLPANAAAGTLARKVVAEACQAWRIPAVLDDAEVVVSELVANGVRHGAGDLELNVALGARFLHLSVRDGNPVMPTRVRPDRHTGTGGRGLMVVDALAASWGSTPSGDGKVVWATLRLPSTQPSIS